jgi:hypothetical protein
MRRDYLWTQPEGWASDLPLYLLQEGNLSTPAQALSCHQEIAAAGAFAVSMLAEFQEPLQRFGAWFYRRLYWECGMIGQLLYLEAEAAGLRGTGIGCYFDEPTHQLLGLQGLAWQVLYHFTVGAGMEDHRIQTLPAYHHRQ